MGWDYVQFRVGYELQRKTGLLKKKFPTSPTLKKMISLEEWKATAAPFFFDSKLDLNFTKVKSLELATDFQNFQNGKLKYFNASLLDIGKKYDWLTNPSTGHQYDASKHWTEIEDISKSAGDIKYTWEKSRFSFLYTLIRHDYHFDSNNAALVFEEIESWINANPINQGPNYKCSQEMSLRILNWTFALYYYKNASELTEELFDKILHYVYWHLKHVYNNINFSLKSVRNNHAITEVLMLYLGGSLFPFFPEAKQWKRKGKKWFEQEIAYQIYEDGTFLQFSHNYHRVLIQLLTWAFYLSEINNDAFSEITYKRAKASLNYLYQCTNPDNGQLPNYGANDGALFFKFNNQPYRDYRPQLNALHYFFTKSAIFEEDALKEDIHWLSSNLDQSKKETKFSLEEKKTAAFETGGYYTIRDENTLSFLRCGSYKDRPSHADNLHLDLWYKGVNIMRDAGTYKYNTEEELVKYFNGTSAHNTVTLGDHDQMLKGPRFIWLHWSEAKSATLNETEDNFKFEGKIHAFKNVGSNILHSRKVTKQKGKAHWEIEDELFHNSGLSMKQIWNPSPSFKNDFEIIAEDAEGNLLEPIFAKGYYSGLYGVKEDTTVIVFETSTKKIKTTIQLR